MASNLGRDEYTQLGNYGALAGNQLQQGLQQVLYTAADQTTTTSLIATVPVDPYLQFQAQANTTYLLQGCLMFTGAGTPSMMFDGPSGSSIEGVVHFFGTGGTSQGSVAILTSLGVAPGTGSGAASAVLIQVNVVITTGNAGGLIGLMWASTNGSTLNLKQGSYLVAIQQQPTAGVVTVTSKISGSYSELGTPTSKVTVITNPSGNNYGVAGPTFTTDPTLQFQAQPNTTYHVTLSAFFVTPGSTGFQLNLIAPANSSVNASSEVNSGTFNAQILAPNTSTFGSTTASGNFSGNVLLNSVNSTDADYKCYLSALITTGAAGGLVGFQVASFSGGSGNITLSANSSMLVVQKGP